MLLSPAPVMVGANAKLSWPVMSTWYGWSMVTCTGICVADFDVLGIPVRFIFGTGGNAMLSASNVTNGLDPGLLSVTCTTTLNGALGALAARGVPLMMAVL